MHAARGRWRKSTNWRHLRDRGCRLFGIHRHMVFLLLLRDGVYSKDLCICLYKNVYINANIYD